MYQAEDDQLSHIPLSNRFYEPYGGSVVGKPEGANEEFISELIFSLKNGYYNIFAEEIGVKLDSVATAAARAETDEEFGKLERDFANAKAEAA